MDDGLGLYNATYNQTEYAPQYIATDNLGPYFAGGIAQLFLAGLAFGNFGRYLSTPTYGSDSRAHRTVLWAVMAQLALVSALGVYIFFFHSTSQARTVDDIFALTVWDSLGPGMEGVVGGLVQAFLLVRASQLLKGRRLMRGVFLSIGLLLILISFLASVAQSVANFSLTYNFWASMGWFTFNTTAAINLWSNAFIDVSLSLALILAVRRHVLGFNPDTDSVLRRLMRTAALTASYTALCGTVAAGLSVAWPASSLTSASIFLAFSLPLSSLYALSLLATMGARRPMPRTRGVVGASLLSTASGTETARRRPGGAESGGAGGFKGGDAARRTLSRLSGKVRAQVGPSQRSEWGPGGYAIQVRTETVEVVDVGADGGMHAGHGGRRRRASGAGYTDAPLAGLT